MRSEPLDDLFGNRRRYPRCRHTPRPSKDDQQVVKCCPNLMHRPGARRRALAAQEVAAEEAVDDRLVDRVHRATRAAEPTVEVLHTLHVLLDRRRWVAALGEIVDEVVERQAQLTASKPAHDARRTEHMLDHDLLPLWPKWPKGSDADYAALFNAPMRDSRGLAGNLRIIAKPA